MSHTAISINTSDTPVVSPTARSLSSKPLATPKGPIPLIRSTHQTPMHASYSYTDPLPMSPISLTSRQPSSTNDTLQSSHQHTIINVIPSNAYISQRNGSILSRAMILKSDFIPTAQVAKLDINISGAPNFRQIRPYPIYACGQPSGSAIRTMLNLMNNQHMKLINGKTIWINLREEPIIYINNRPYVLRELDTPYHNLIDFQGINYERLNSIEQRLKLDIINESVENNGNILIHEETNDGDIIALWESAHDVRTSSEMIDELNRDGYDVQWWRVPITAESVFEPNQFDALVRAYTNAMINSNNKFQCIINCQFGRGRSTMGVLVMYLLNTHMSHQLTQPQTHKLNFNDTNNIDQSDLMSSYRAGNWNAIVRLVRLLSNGRTAKSIVDHAIDMCGRIHNIRDAIVDSFLKAERARVDDTHQVHSTYMTAHLKRYFYLICFQAYLLNLPNDVLTVASNKNHTFQQWLHDRPELVKLTDTFTIDDFDHELLISKSTTPTGTQLSTPQLSVDEQFVLKRHGAVLGKNIIIKSEYYAKSQQLNTLSADTRTNTSYRKLHNIPLGATAQVSVLGIRNILDALIHERHEQTINDTSAQQYDANIFPLNHQLSTNDIHKLDGESSTSTTQLQSKRSNCHVMWINLREEPVIFINNNPYLLRDTAHPYRALPEFTSGITAERCETIENGFVHDVIHEWNKSSDHTILVSQEAILHTIVPRYEPVESPDNIQTCKQVFEQLVNDQYDVQYSRIPLHVDQTPGLRSFDKLYDLLSSRKLITDHINVVFQDQKGGRRSTLGMVVALLMMTVAQESLDFTLVQENGHIISHLHGTHIHDDENDTSQHNERIIELCTNQPTHIRVTVSSHDTYHASNTTESTHILPLKEYRSDGTTIPPRRRQLSVTTDDDDGGDVLDEVQRHYGNPGNYKSILQLIRVIKRGKQVKDEVDIAIDICGSTFHLRDAIADAKQRAEQDRTNHTSKPRLARAIKLLESYAYLIAFNAYLHERHDFTSEMEKKSKYSNDYINNLTSPLKPNSSFNRFDNKLTQSDDSTTSTYNDYPSFSQWISGRGELRLAIENIRRQPEDALKIVVLSLDNRFGVTDELRSGNVLVRGSILKSDYFIGCINKNIEQIVDGAINFRPITQFPVAGTGIPTSDGIIRVLHFFGMTDPPDLLSTTYMPLFQAESCIWFNLREEPLLYVNHRPFVLRDSDVPYTNIEHTGITARRLEAMEKQLKRDALQESIKCGNKLLLHDEDELGNLIVHWEDIHHNSIRTPREQYIESMKLAAESIHNNTNNKQFHAMYYRTPITDEQAPSPAMLDDLMKYLQMASTQQNRQLIFNCQMGRGRTTTGLVIACMWCLFKGEIKFDVLHNNNNNNSSVTNQSSQLTRRSDSKFIDELSDIQYMHNQLPQSIGSDMSEDTVKRREYHHSKKLTKGWYRIIQSLARVLPDGPKLKYQVDSVIDHCAAFQNLRIVIYQQQQACLDALPRKKHTFIHRGTNYLIRYFYLIVIGAYLSHLFNHCDMSNTTLPITFREYLAKRPEITNLLENSVVFPELDTIVSNAPNSPLMSRGHNRQTLSTSNNQLFSNTNNSDSVPTTAALPPLQPI